MDDLDEIILAVAPDPRVATLRHNLDHMCRTNSGHAFLWSLCLTVARWIVLLRAGEVHEVPSLQRDLVLVLLGGPSDVAERPWPGVLDDWLDADTPACFAQFARRALVAQCGRDRDAAKRHPRVLERWATSDTEAAPLEDVVTLRARLAALRGHADLPGRDLPVLELLLKGYRNREAAEALGLSDVQVHRAVERINDILRRLP
jgi:hypothetical protein